MMCHLVDKARFFQQVLVNHRSLYRSSSVEMNINVFSKPTGIVVSIGLCISKGCGEFKKKLKFID